MSVASAANAGRLPSTSLRFWSLPVTAVASSCCQVWKACLVVGSSALKMSESWTVGSTWLRGSVPPSATGGAFG